MTNRVDNVTHEQLLTSSRVHQVHPNLDGTTLFRSTASWQNIRTGVDDPQWRTKLRAGGDVTHNYSATYIRTLQVNPGTCTVVGFIDKGGIGQDVRTQRGTGIIAGTLAVPHDLAGSVSADNSAIVNLLRNVRSQTSSMEGFVFLGELGESFRMVSRPAHAFRQGMSRYLGAVQRRTSGIASRRYPSTEAQRRAVYDMLTGTWLEFSFGWQPLINDTRAIAESIARLSRKNLQHNRLRGFGVDESYETHNVPIVTHDSWICTQQQIVERGDTMVVYRAGYRNDHDAGSITGWADRLVEVCNLDLSQALPAAWELLPWSFVVDYFTNIGNILQAGATATSSLTWKCKTKIVRVERIAQNPVDHARIRTVLGPSYISSSGQHLGFGVVEKRVITRTGFTNSGLTPTFAWSIPGTRQTWNLGALGGQLGNARNQVNFYRR